jgi:hypothetical protein
MSPFSKKWMFVVVHSAQFLIQGIVGGGELYGKKVQTKTNHRMQLYLSLQKEKTE